jgi:hypothetical protein
VQIKNQSLVKVKRRVRLKPYPERAKLYEFKPKIALALLAWGFSPMFLGKAKAIP